MSTDTTAGAPAQDVIALRGHLFDTLAALRDKANPMPVDRARAISEVARTIIDTARVEVDAAKLHKRALASGFLQLASPSSPMTPPLPGTPAVPNGITGITRHALKDE